MSSHSQKSVFDKAGSVTSARTKNKSPSRRRKCTDVGKEYLGEQCLKNRDSSKRKILALIQELENYLGCNDFSRVPDLLKSLIVERDEYNRSRLRYENMHAGEDHVPQEEAALQLLQGITEIQERAANAMGRHNYNDEFELERRDSRDKLEEPLEQSAVARGNIR